MITVQTTVIQGPMVTYWDIRDGHILDRNETLCLHGIDYRVVCPCVAGYALEASPWHVHDDAVFVKLGIKDKLTFASMYGDVLTGNFPVMNSFISLTRLVKALYEKPEYEEGEWVTIVPRKEELSGSYPFGYTSDMERYVGKTYQIKRVELTTSIIVGAQWAWAGDPHGYFLDTPIGYTWHSSMFRKVTDAEIAAVKIDTPFTLATPPLAVHACVEELDTVRPVRRDTHCDAVSDIEDILEKLREGHSSVGLDKVHDESSTKIQIPNTDKSFHIKL